MKGGSKESYWSWYWNYSPNFSCLGNWLLVQKQENLLDAKVGNWTSGYSLITETKGGHK